MNEFTSHHLEMTDKELVRIAYFDIMKFKKEARASAKEILNQRGISKSQIEILKQEIREAKRIERKQKLKDKNQKYGLWDFIIDTMLNG